MVSIARENLFHEKIKTLMSIGGVVLSVFLIFTINGVYMGMVYTMDSIVYNTGADLWITQEGTSGSLHSPSLVNTSIEGDLENIDGIKEYTPLIRTAVVYKAEDSNILLFINGYNPDGDLGKAWNVVKGKDTPENGEILVDRVFATKNKLAIRDNIKLQSKTFEIVGLTEDTNIMVGFMAFLTYEDAEKFINVPGFTNSFIIKAESTADIETLKSEIEDVISDVDVKTSEEVAQAYKEEVLGSFDPIMLVLSAIALFVGTLVIALLIYMITLEKSKEYGIIKAVGATNLHLYKIVLSQALLISIIGYVVGAIISIPLILIIQNIVPEFFVVVTLDMVIQGFFLFIGTGIIASFIPIRRLTSIDPALVFKG
ncbi:MAG: ABC transporter permease [Promethearchaeota archaeon]